MGKQVTVAIIGLGARGRFAYAPFARQYPGRMKLAAIADLLPERVRAVAAEYGVPPERCFSSGEELLSRERLADAAFICTQDAQHYGHAAAALKKGYDLLLEKPISPNMAECRALVRLAEQTGRRVAVCHLLRYTEVFQTLKRLLEEGALGELVSIQAIENVGYWHAAHSFVRGNWRNSAETSPMILAKSCHDMDLLLWLAGRRCLRVSSFGSRSVFRADHAPAGSAPRCLDAGECRGSCPFDAEKIYLDLPGIGLRSGNAAWPVNVLDPAPTEAGVLRALREGPYGRCVYHCDNDVVDHQVVNLELEGGVTVSFTMCSLTSGMQRCLKLMGSRGDAEIGLEDSQIVLRRFGAAPEVLRVSGQTDYTGHAGGDVRMLDAFIRLEAGEPGCALTSLENSVESHYVAMAAEQSRRTGGVAVPLADFIASLPALA